MEKIGYLQDEKGNKSHIRLTSLIGQVCALFVACYGIHKGCDLFGLSFVVMAFISPVGFKAWQKRYEKNEFIHMKDM